MPSRTAQIKLVVVNPHGVLRDGLRGVLEKHRDIRVVGSVGECREAARLAPDVVVTEVAIPVLSGIESTRAIAQTNSNIGVIVISFHDSRAILRRILEAGARAILLKDCGADDLVKAARAVAAGEKYFSSGIADTVFDNSRRTRSDGDRADDLTATERGILRLIADGKSNSEAAALLRLSPRTVETYRIRAMRKLDLKDLASLVKFAIRHGLTTLE